VALFSWDEKEAQRSTMHHSLVTRPCQTRAKFSENCGNTRGTGGLRVCVNTVATAHVVDFSGFRKVYSRIPCSPQMCC
jgi:hypothetical protein